VGSFGVLRTSCVGKEGPESWRGYPCRAWRVAGSAPKLSRAWYGRRPIRAEDVCSFCTVRRGFVAVKRCSRVLVNWLLSRLLTRAEEIVRWL
jgi:hypothetical protein